MLKLNWTRCELEVFLWIVWGLNKFEYFRRIIEKHVHSEDQ